MNVHFLLALTWKILQFYFRLDKIYTLAPAGCSELVGYDNHLQNSNTKQTVCTECYRYLMSMNEESLLKPTLRKNAEWSVQALDPL